MTPPIPDRRRAGTALLLLGALLVVAAGVRGYALGRESFWIDELFSLQTSAGNGLAHERLPSGRWLDPAPRPTDLHHGGGVYGIAHWSHEDTQAPLYFVLLHGWRQVFGSGEPAVRMLSLLCSLATVMLTCAVIREVTPEPDRPVTAALLAAGLMAVSGTQIAFAQEARPYALALALTLAAAWAVARIAVKGFSWGRGLGVGGAVLALMLTHYTGIAPAFAIGLFAVLVLRGQARRRTAAMLIGAGIVFFLAWGPFLLGQTGSPGVRLAFLNDESAGHALRTLDRVLQQPLSLLLWSPRPGQQPFGWAWAARGFGLIVLVAPLLLMRRRPALLLGWLLAAGPIALTAVSDLASTRAALELPRFSFLGSAGVAMTLSLLVTMLPARGTAVAGGVVLLVLATALLAPHWIARPSPYDRGKPDARAWAARLAEAWRPGEAIVIARPADLPWSAGAMWLAISHYATPPGPLVVLDGPADDALASRLATAPGVWMISPTPGLPVEPLLPGWQADGTPIQQRNLGTAARVRAGRAIPR